MMRKLFGICTGMLIFISSRTLSQDPDSLVLFSDLYFQSGFEEMVFSGIDRGENVSLEDLYLAIDTYSEDEASRYKSRLETLITGLVNEGIEHKRDKKKIRSIYEDTHDTFMAKYEEDACFPDLFRNGDFNCVTGSMVYGLIFEALGIPYTIQKGMNHVNLLAYPHTRTILVESTDAETGLVSMNTRMKNEYLDQLSKGKLITPEKRMHGNINDIFLEYAIREGTIDTYELASFQYSNRGISRLNDLDYEAAYQDFEKAYYLSPGKELSYTLLQVGTQILHLSDYRDPSHVMLLCKLYRFRDLGVSEDDILSEFERITGKIFVDRHDKDAYDRAYTILCDNLDNNDLTRKISLMYYGSLVDDLLRDGYLKATLEYLHEINRLDPDNRQIQDLILNILLQNIRDYMGTAPEKLEFLDQYRDQFPEVFEIHSMKLVDLTLILESAEYWFNEDNAKKAEEYMERFEQHEMDRNELYQLGLRIELTYKTAAYYYYKKNDLGRSRDYLDAGLKIIPNSRHLKQIRESF